MANRDLVFSTISEEVGASIAASLPQTSSLPQSVEKFCDNIDVNFKRTASALRARAIQLRDAADELDDRALRLSEAATFTVNQITETVQYERECSARQQSLALVKVD